MRSMTGYGSGTVASDTARVTVEMTSVNRKQADVVVHMPRSIAALEPAVRRAVAQVTSRGRLTVSIHLEPLGDGKAALKVNDHLATE
ncbi:MAG: YicC/YloC family endoribonuclease, partial [Verrucomicrobiota bacterium]